jgi:two-component system, LytTR family, sensor kinase
VNAVRGTVETIRGNGIVGRRGPRYARLAAMHPFALGVIGASLVAVTLSAQIYLSMFDHGHSFIRMVAWQLCSWSVWAFATPIVLRLGGRLSERGVRAVWGSIAVRGLLIVGVQLVVASLSTMLIQPYVPMSTYTLEESLLIHVLSLPTDVAVFGVLLLIGSSVAISHRARNLEVRESRLEADLARAQLDALRLEVEPHFLFNTLNSIASLIRTRSTDRALSMLLGLSELLRTTVDGRQHTTTLGEETEFVKRYIELQRVRFSDRLDVRYAISPESTPCAVPSFLLQPLVENAFRHGVAKHAGPCRLELSASVERGELQVCVRDNGAGLPANFSVDSHSGTGLSNIRLRLQRIYDGAARLELEPADGGGTVARVTLPVHRGPFQRPLAALP